MGIETDWYPKNGDSDSHLDEDMVISAPTKNDMTWRELADLMGQEARKLALGQDISKTLKLSGAALLNVQVRTKKSVDAAIVAYCREQKWPELEVESRLMLARRLLFGEMIVRGFAMLKGKDGKCPFPENSGWDQASLLEWTLIDAWQRYALLEMQLRP